MGSEPLTHCLAGKVVVFLGVFGTGGSSGDLSLALCGSVVKEDGKFLALVGAQDWPRLLPAPSGLYLWPALRSPEGFPSRLSPGWRKRGSAYFGLGPEEMDCRCVSGIGFRH